MLRSHRTCTGRYRWLLPVAALGAVALLGGCVAYPAGYYGYNGGYGYGYAPAPYYASTPYVAFGLGGGGDWGDRDWHEGGDWHGGGGWHHGGGDGGWHH